MMVVSATYFTTDFSSSLGEQSWVYLFIYLFSYLFKRIPVDFSIRCEQQGAEHTALRDSPAGNKVGVTTNQTRLGSVCEALQRVVIMLTVWGYQSVSCVRLCYMKMIVFKNVIEIRPVVETFKSEWRTSQLTLPLTLIVKYLASD